MTSKISTIHSHPTKPVSSDAMLEEAKGAGYERVFIVGLKRTPGEDMFDIDDADTFFSSNMKKHEVIMALHRLRNVP